MMHERDGITTTTATTSFEINHGTNHDDSGQIMNTVAAETTISAASGSATLNYQISRDDSFDVTRNEPPITVLTSETKTDGWQMLASVAGNVLEWFDFAVFGYLSDILGEVFFPPSKNDDKNEQQTMKAFFVFGLAFLMRPIGGLVFGYIGDYHGRKKALVTSMFLMAFPTFIMGTLPGYKTVGRWAVFFLVVVRLLQGLSVGGQLVSSLVYLLENQNPNHWGFYGSFAMAAAIFGSLLGGLTSFVLRATLSHDQLVAWGWRIPFLCGIIVSYFGFYLRSHGGDHDGYHVPGQESGIDGGNNMAIHSIDPKLQNPLRDAFNRKNLRALFAASLVPMLWSSTFYLSFVWMPIFMAELSDNPVPGAFLINTVSLFLSVCLIFPIAGMLSDTYGRVRIMTLGGTMLVLLSPLLVIAIGRGKPALALLSQCILGFSLSLFSAPMCAWLVEAFEPRVRLTSVAIGYNIAQALAGGITPFLATLVSNELGQKRPGWIITVVAIISLIGLLVIAPKNSSDKDPTRESIDLTAIESANGII